MDSISITISLIVVFIFIIPFIIMHMNKEKIEKAFNQYYTDNNLTIDTADSVGKKTLAIDRKRNLLVATEYDGKHVKGTSVEIKKGIKADVDGDEEIGINLKIGDAIITLTSDDDGIEIGKEAKIKADKWKAEINRLANE